MKNNSKRKLYYPILDSIIQPQPSPPNLPSPSPIPPNVPTPTPVPSVPPPKYL